MTKDGMKDKISMALKDPILQMGFEVICSKLSRLEKENAELKEKISVLLSCTNCPENKGGWGCEKEYENKCLTQKIVYIKELKEENAELDCQMNRNKFCYSCANATDRCFTNEIGCPCEKYKSYKDENAELKEENTKLKERNAELAGQKASLERWFSEAKAIIRKYYNYNHICGYSYEAIDKQAEQFLKEV